MTYEQKGITCRQCFIDNTYICQTKSKYHFFIFIYTGNVQTFTAPLTTSYKCECWGASGGWSSGSSANYLEGCGAYSNGIIRLSENYIFYIYVGERGLNGFSPGAVNFDHVKSGTFNGGGGILHPSPDKNNSTGGGATDIRLTNGNWNDFNSLKSRILVAAGGGTCINDPQGKPSHAGGLLSQTFSNTFKNTGTTNEAQGATQTSGYKFGIGQDGGRAGAGGGYYGGCAIDLKGNISGIRGAGGSSFISGHTGCNAINSSSTESKITHTGSPNHYSGKVFTNTVMKAGNESMPSPAGGTETGHSGNGYCKITWHPAL